MAGSAFKLGKIAYTKQDITSAGGTTVLLNNSDRYQYVTGSTTQTIQLPDATTMVVALGFKVINGNTAGSVTVVNNGSVTQATLSPGQSAEFVLDNNGSANGVWMVLQGGSGTSGFVATENSQTGTTYTFVLSDGSNATGVSLVSFNNASPVTATIPPNSGVAFPIGTEINLIQKGAGQTTIAPGAGVTIDSLNGYTNLAGQYAEATLIKTATNTWYLYGTLTNNFIQATGGVISFNGNQKVHTFNSSSSFVITGGSGTVASLVVAGGGGGGTGGSSGVGVGGGGAGGLIYTTPGASLGVGTYTVTVGAGGNGGSVGSTGTSGGNSQFNGMTAAVGGGGGGGDTGAPTGLNGGSGGGGGHTSGTSSGGTGTVGQGSAGGTGSNAATDVGGGGGGAGGTGGNGNSAGSIGGTGGIGVSNSITGTAISYAGGGGGGTGTGTAGTASGGGGAGGSNAAGSNASSNTGGGGGGSGSTGSGGSGGSGVVILSYQYQ